MLPKNLIIVLLFAGCSPLLTGCTSWLASEKNAEGCRLLRAGNRNAAMENFKDASYLDPANPVSYYNIAKMHHDNARDLQSPEELAKAKQYYQNAISVDPGHVPTRRSYALLLVEQGKRNSAIQMLQAWANSFPEEAIPQVELARLYEDLGDTKMARRSLNKALSVDPENKRGLELLARSEERSGNRAVALAHYERAARLDPSDVKLARYIAELRELTPSSSPSFEPNRRETAIATRPDTGGGGSIR